VTCTYNDIGWFATLACKRSHILPLTVAGFGTTYLRPLFERLQPYMRDNELLLPWLVCLCLRFVEHVITSQNCFFSLILFRTLT